MVDGPGPEVLGHRYKHCPIFDIDHFRGRRLNEVEGDTINFGIRLAIMDKGGGNEKIHKLAQPEFLNAVDGKFPPLVADYTSRYFPLISGWDCSSSTVPANPMCAFPMR